MENRECWSIFWDFYWFLSLTWNLSKWNNYSTLKCWTCHGAIVTVNLLLCYFCSVNYLSKPHHHHHHHHHPALICSISWSGDSWWVCGLGSQRSGYASGFSYLFSFVFVLFYYYVEHKFVCESMWDSLLFHWVSEWVSEWMLKLIFCPRLQNCCCCCWGECWKWFISWESVEQIVWVVIIFYFTEAWEGGVSLYVI